MGSAPPPLDLPHFPDRLHAFVWRNWQLVPLERMARVVGARPRDLRDLGRAMGLKGPPAITANQQRRSFLTVIRRNWHLLPYEQLLELLGWTPDQMAYTLREDDFLFVKLGNLKPRCARLRYAPPDARTQARQREIAALLQREFPAGVGLPETPLFDFVDQLSKPTKTTIPVTPGTGFSPRYCYSYFALYGDPLLEPDLDPYPDGYLARLAECGVDGVWLQGVLAKLAPFPWAPEPHPQHDRRLENLRRLVARARARGIGVYLYLNEPRALPLAFYQDRPELKGVVEGDYAALCSSVPAVQDYLASAVATICQAVPDLAGFFTISASENLSNCWSHHNGATCPRCQKRSPAEVIAEVNTLFHRGIQRAGGRQRLIVWDWGWADAWAEGIIERLPQDVAHMSVSEWSIPIQRGGVPVEVGEYSISVVGPGPRAQRHWAWARKRGLKTLAKVQCGNTWELSAVPYIPALENVARHAANLRQTGVGGLMLGWTLGGYPSPNLEVVAEIAKAPQESEPPDPLRALEAVATRRFGTVIAPAIVQAWRAFSTAFSEFPFHGGLVYNAPMQLGPANLLWPTPTGYHATMVGFPYDDLDGWRAAYPPEVFVDQFEKVADGFEHATAELADAFQNQRRQLSSRERQALLGELRVMEAAGIHFRSTANQARFVLARRALANAKSPTDRETAGGNLATLLQAETQLALRLHDLQSRDSRLGFEASNQYYYVPLDLAEKVLNCRHLLRALAPDERPAVAPGRSS